MRQLPPGIGMPILKIRNHGGSRKSTKQSRHNQFILTIMSFKAKVLSTTPISNPVLTLYRYGNGAQLKPGEIQKLDLEYGDVSSLAFASPSVADNNNEPNFELEIVSWSIENIKGKGVMHVTVKNIGSTPTYPAVSVLFATQG